jgi:hypothetical protein
MFGKRPDFSLKWLLSNSSRVCESRFLTIKHSVQSSASTGQASNYSNRYIGAVSPTNTRDGRGPSHVPASSLFPQRSDLTAARAATAHARTPRAQRGSGHLPAPPAPAQHSRFRVHLTGSGGSRGTSPGADVGADQGSLPQHGQRSSRRPAAAAAGTPVPAKACSCQTSSTTRSLAESAGQQQIAGRRPAPVEGTRVMRPAGARRLRLAP